MNETATHPRVYNNIFFVLVLFSTDFHYCIILLGKKEEKKNQIIKAQHEIAVI